MQSLLTLCFKLLKRVSYFLIEPINKIIVYIYLYINNAKFGRFNTYGIPFISIAKSGKFLIGQDFIMNNILASNPIGRNQKCIFFVDKDAELIIGNNVGISGTALVAHKKITIEDNVKIGGGVCIYDTDFHSLDSAVRSSEMDYKNTKCASVLIKKNAFIGAHSTILKGVIIGENSIIGACSVVTKSVPDNEIWAGNPARFLKKL